MKNGLVATLVGGILGGALDIIYAFIAYGPLSFGVTPMQVLQSVAAGAIGREASRAGEWNTALLGLGLHFFIALGMAAVFVGASSVVKVLRTRALLCGFLYGFLLYVAMNYIIVPLSAAGANLHFAASFAEVSERLQNSFSEVRGGGGGGHTWLIFGTLFAHTVLVGMSIGWATKRFSAE